jgi:hypothetical protein
MRAGFVVFSPITHSHPIHLHGVPGDWGYWEAFDRVMIGACSRVVVLRLDGWKESRGVKAEISIAQELGKPVECVDPITEGG